MEGTRYRVLSPIGRGTFGTVYRAEMLGASDFTRAVALKVPHPTHPTLSESPAAAARLRDEARILGLINHQAIVKSTGFVSVEGRLAVVMELVEGAPLRGLEPIAGLPLEVALDIVVEVAGALHAAYHTLDADRGVMLKVTHRDIKPENIYITPTGAVKLLDFGLASADFEARESAADDPQTGTYRYLAPEQPSERYGPQGDIYALGAVLFELISGRTVRASRLSPRRHDANTEEALEALEVALESRKTLADRERKALVDCLREMLGAHPETRPSARDLTRKLTILRRALGGETLRDWAERAVPFLMAAQNQLTPDGLVGRTFPEPERPRGDALYYLPGESAEVTEVSVSPPPVEKTWITVDDALKPHEHELASAADAGEEAEGFPIIDSPHVQASPVDMELVAAVRRELLEQEEDRPEPVVTALVSIIIFMLIAGVGTLWSSWNNSDQTLEPVAAAAETIARGSARGSSDADGLAAPTTLSPNDDVPSKEVADDEVADDEVAATTSAATASAVLEGDASASTTGGVPAGAETTGADNRIASGVGVSALGFTAGTARSAPSNDPVDSKTGGVTDGSPVDSAGTGVPLVVLAAKLRGASAISGCFAAHRDDGGAQVETVTVHITVSPDGGVSAVSTAGALAGTPLAGCLSGAIRAIRFQPFVGDARTYPFPLTPRW